MLNLVRRMWRAALLDADLYDEVESDPRLASQAFVVVVLVSIAGGIGAGWPHLGGVVLGAAILFAGWIGWAAVSNWLGTRLLPEPETDSSFQEMLRTIGFAASPGLLALLGLFPEIRLPAFACAMVWMLAATVVAIREALDYRSTARAVLVCSIGWVIQAGAAALALFLLVATAKPAL
jgi:Yip1 domain